LKDGLGFRLLGGFPVLVFSFQIPSSQFLFQFKLASFLLAFDIDIDTDIDIDIDIDIY
jgi:hypothetical protein